MPPPVNRPKFPEKAHEDLAVWVEETIAELGILHGRADRNKTRAEGAAAKADSVQVQLPDVTGRVDNVSTQLAALTARVDDLTARVAALETPIL